MGWKGLIRDTVMFVIGFSLMLGWMDAQTAALVLIVVAAAFTVYAWYRFLKR